MGAAPVKTERLEALVQVFILIAIAGMAGAASFTHVHNWTMSNAPHGTGSWFGWANAVISELTPTAAGIEIRRRKRRDRHARVAYPMAILVAAAILSLSAQVAEARPTIGGWISSAVPALAFLALTKLVLSRNSGNAKEETSCAQDQPGHLNQAGEPSFTTTGMTTPDGPESLSAATAPPAAPSPAAQNPAPAMPFSPQNSAPLNLTPDTLRDLRPVPSGQLLMSARMAVFSHQQETGNPITPGELATRMSIPPALAESILDHLGGTGTPPPVTAANGTPHPGSRP
jgi:hypothetical protein